MSVEHSHLAVSDLAHRPGHEDAALQLLREAADRYLASGSGRAVIQVGGNAPVIARLRAGGVPTEVEIGPGLMVLVTGKEWVARAGFRNTNEAIEGLFRSDPPIMWQRDGY